MSAEQVNGFIDEYSQGLQRYSGESWTKRKKLALTDAQTKWIPNAGKMMEGALKGNGSYTEEGRELVRGIALAVRRAKKSEIPFVRAAVEVIKEDTKIDEQKITSMVMYREWIDEKNFVPSDSILEYFSDYDTTTWGNCRAKLIREGYTFERMSGYGWKVTGRPQKIEPVAEEKISVMGGLNAEEFAKLKELLGKI